MVSQAPARSGIVQANPGDPRMSTSSEGSRNSQEVASRSVLPPPSPADESSESVIDHGHGSHVVEIVAEYLLKDSLLTCRKPLCVPRF